MLRIDRILYPTDFSEQADIALDYALELAQRHDAVVHMLHAVVLHADDPNDPAHHFPDAEDIGRRLEEIAEGRMSDRLEERDAGGVEVRRVKRRGISTAPVILDYAAEADVDLIVMSTHGRRGLSHLLLGSITEEVVRLAQCPVLTIRARGESVSASAPGRVLVPVDFSEHSVRAVAHAKEICAAYEAELHVVHVFEPIVQPEIYTGGAIDLPGLPAMEGNLRRGLERLVRAAPGPDLAVAVHVRQGRAVGEILDAADALDADLVVIATHGLTGLSHMLLGSVAEKVVRRAGCPVLTVKAFGKSLIG